MHAVLRVLLATAVAASLVFGGRGAAAQSETPDLVLGDLELRLERVVTLCRARDWRALRLALLDAAPVVRRLTLTCWEPNAAGAEFPLLLLGDPDASVRGALADLLGRWDNSEGRFAPIEQLLVDPAPEVRLAAAEQVVEVTPDEAAGLLLPLLSDPSLAVAAAAAAQLQATGGDRVLPDAALDDYAVALSVHQLELGQPELAGAVAHLDERLQALRGRFNTRALNSDTERACADAIGLTLDRLGDELRMLAAEATQYNPVGDNFGQVLRIEDDLWGVTQSFETCLTATPLEFYDWGEPSVFDHRALTLTTEVGSRWDLGFGLLRADLPPTSEGGEYWLRSQLDLNVFLPDRLESAPASLSNPSLFMAGRVVRDQLFRNEELSRFGGAGLLRGHVPLPCPGGVTCLWTTSVFSELSAGDDDDYPHRLVAEQRRFGADTGVTGEFSDTNASLLVAVERTEYDDALSAADLDIGRATLNIDSVFQLRFTALRGQYLNEGAIVPPADGASIGRDGTILDSAIGVRFGELGSDDLRLYILGGAAIPLMDDDALDLNPQITFESVLALDGGSYGEPQTQLRVGGRRSVGPSPRDFALQGVTHSFLDFHLWYLELPESGVHLRLFVEHILTHHIAPISDQEELDINLVGGGFAVRFLIEEWLGFNIENRTDGIGMTGREVEVHNRFTLSLFVPLGGYGFGQEEALPW